MTEKILKTKYGDVHYWINAIDLKRDSLFFLHGLTASHDLFREQIPHFERLYNVITWDAPAHGLSRPFKDFTYEKAAQAAVQILDENGIESAAFIGQSMGGFITQSVIKRFPERVWAFVSIDSTPFGEKYYSKSDRWWLRQIEWMSALYPDRLLRKAVAKQCTVTEKSYQNMFNMLSVYDKKELCHLMGIGFAGFLEDNCDIKIECPVLLLVGEHDKTGKVIQYNKEWAKDLNINVTWVKDAAHNSNDDNPELVNSFIETFLTIIRVKNLEDFFYITKSNVETADDAESLDALQSDIDRLESYYTGPLWKADFAMDEEGKLPDDLNRGVLSEDGIYNLLEQYKEKRDETHE